MIVFKIILAIFLSLMYISMMTVMVIFERDKPKNIIIWSVVFLVSQIVGYVIYIIIRNVFYKKMNALYTKKKEDAIYDGLIANKTYDNSTKVSHQVFDFNSLAFKTHTTENNSYEIFDGFSTLNESLIVDLQKAKSYIFLELTKVFRTSFENIKTVLMEKAKNNVTVKLVHDSKISHRLIRELKRAGVKVYRFSRYNTADRVYSNLRNAITIDGDIIYLANLNISNRQYNEKQYTAYTFLKLMGDIVQDINVQIHKDTIFASGKFIHYEEKDKINLSNKTLMQFVANDIQNDLELALIKAICSAKKSIQMQLNCFIPSASIISLLNFAINSDIEVKIMVPLKTELRSKFFASRAYAKQLALYGANVYLYDGYINSNAITIDDEYVIFGSYIIDREHLNTNPQSMLFIKDEKAVKTFNDMFDVCIDNSYRINNAKFMLLKEKFFKNFV